MKTPIAGDDAHRELHDDADDDGGGDDGRHDDDDDDDDGGGYDVDGGVDDGAPCGGFPLRPAGCSSADPPLLSFYRT